MLSAYPPIRYNNYEFFRDGKPIGAYRGVLIKDKKPYIDFPQKLDIAYGDEIHLPNNPCKFFVVDIDYIYPESIRHSQIHHFNVYYVPEHQFKRNSQPIFNIGTINNSIVGTQTNASININHFEQLKIEIEKCAVDDKPLLYELYNTLKEISNNTKPIKRNALQKFGDLFVKYSPIALAVGQLLVDILL